ncbi:hypothetical protein SUGI_0003600 [Cryptomeria japonica]|nr:hypothetical protein SUGI_0003600 [Cryptomeria japonica]
MVEGVRIEHPTSKILSSGKISKQQIRFDLNRKGKSSWRESQLDESFDSVSRRIYESIELMTGNITNEVADKFPFCITDVDKERNDAFNFSSNPDFLSLCLLETDGDMLRRLCSVAEVKFYFNTYVRTGDAYVNNNCNSSSWGPGCEPGWSSTTSTVFDLQNPTKWPARTENSKPCCSGFFCPRGLTCMIPCPLGAYCPRAKLNSSTGLCDPYSYQLTPRGVNHTCGGADRWADVKRTDEVFCSAGFYCPTTTERTICSDGHYCRLGSTSQSRCYPFTTCEPNSTNQNIQAYGVMLIVIIITLLLLIYNCSDQLLVIRERRRAKAREAAARSARESMRARERWQLAREAGKRWASKRQRQLSRTFSCIQSSKNPEEEETLAPSGPLLSDDVSFVHLSTIPEENVEQKSSVELRDLYEIQPSYIADQEEDPKKDPSLAFIDPNVNHHKANKHHIGHSRIHLFEYAYGEIEKEKMTQTNHLTLMDAISKATLGGIKSRPQIEVSFKDLSLTLKGNGKKILRNVTGKLMPGRIAAVMGPSGAGKTTFLNALAGKATGCVVTGSVLINGKPESIYSYKKIIGFVPQDDIVHGNLTVEENLWFSARCRLPVSMPEEEKVFIVERVIEALGLQSVRDSLVGTVEKRGISGGQRKRVNVGLEMVMEPSLLILDEPTSGLDSTSSQLLLKALRREALAGVNISMVLHQPSYGLFKMFDDIMLLAKGGCTVYLGPADEIEKYFSSLGINVPDRINPPDHFMDILEGIVKPDGNPNFECNDLPIKWLYSNGYEIPVDLQKASARGSNTNNNPSSSDNGNIKTFGQDLWEEVWCNIELKWDSIRHSFLRVKDFSNRQTPSFFKQFILFLRRVAKQRFRDARVQAQDYLILLLCGIFMGILAKVKDEDFGFAGYTYTIISMSLLCMIAALRTFSQDKMHYWRESAAGMNRVAYFAAKDSIDHFNTVIKPLVYLSMFYFFNNPRSTFAANYIVTLVMVYCVEGIAYIFAITLNPGSAQLCSVLFPVISVLLATQKEPVGIMKHLMKANYSRWALEAYMIANAKMYSGVWLISRCGALWGRRKRQR